LDLLGSTLSKDTILAKVISPYNFKVLEEIKAPYKENVMTHIRAISSVSPGDRAYVVGNLNTAEWIEN